MNLSYRARLKRKEEYLRLKSLPFLTPPQQRKLSKLAVQYRHDNYYKFQCAKVK